MKRTALRRYTFLRPFSLKKREPLKTYDDGREVLNIHVSAGEREYRKRTWEMHDRQNGLCCICGMRMLNGDVTFEHEAGRGMGGAKRDDRIVLPDGSWINGAAHGRCNVQKGSKVVEYVTPQK